MRITVTRTGGFGGLTRRATLRTDGRPDAAELAALARSALAEGRAEPSTGVPDGFHYEIETDDGTTYCADPRLTEAQSALIGKVFREGGTDRG
ncbi:metalloprotease [Streptomyces abyssalis]|uniref:Metalloprotease n=1 Tax=Streptomyces abyssalis TaxID=933944 RepID=A0A1E7JK15_9ACTN|nr:protealysin inhibitor emfourin [Streptomyces abyssalis]OEU85061.1 metalloprotease [Streptomyces abyssalis]OEU87983.1 metalloprotease [Streptomyces abyssalis]OEV29756.1 metalloprotease [Streptomyces nanshensis]